jgi:excinuclease UvrABC nuclease subunit
LRMISFPWLLVNAGNVRLASKIVNWSINIKNQSQIIATHDEAETEKHKSEKHESVLDKISGIGKKTLDALVEAGFDDIDVLHKTTAEDLTKVKGVGKKRAEQIIEELKDLT